VAVGAVRLGVLGPFLVLPDAGCPDSVALAPASMPAAGEFVRAGCDGLRRPHLDGREWPTWSGTGVGTPKGRPAAGKWRASSTPIFGPDRVAYWRECLTASQTQGHSRRAPAGARLAEINNEIADLTRRLQRQVLNLEADDITPAARRQITTRMAELEATVTRRQADADQARAELDSLPPDIDETSQALARLPQLADGLADLPQGDLRGLYNALDVRVMYQPVDRAIDIEITLTDAIGDISALAPPDNRVGPASQFCSVPPAGFEPALPPPEGGALSPELRGLGDQRRVTGGSTLSRLG
jgi:hypothetical protein